MYTIIVSLLWYNNRVTVLQQSSSFLVGCFMATARETVWY